MKGANIEIKNKIGATPLHETVLGKRIEAIECLLKMNARVNVKRGDGYTPLALSVMNTKDLEIPKMLLAAGADPNLVQKDGVSPLFFAIKTQNVEAMKLLLSNKADVCFKSPKKIDRSPIFTAVLDDCGSFFDLAYQDRDINDDLQVFNRQQLNAVTLAAFLGNWKFVTLFSRLSKGKIDFEDNEGFTPFMRLVIAGELEGAEYVRKLGAKVDYTSQQQETCLFKCMKEAQVAGKDPQQDKRVKYLLE